MFKLSELKASSYNPRTISASALAGLTASIKKFGCVEPIIVNIRGKKNAVVGGHQRLRILKQLKRPDYRCACVTVDLAAADEKLLNLTLNNPKAQGIFIDSLDEHIDQLREELGNETNIMELQVTELRKEVSDTGIIYREEKIEPFTKTHVLLSFAPALLPQIADFLEAIIRVPGVEYEQSSN